MFLKFQIQSIKLQINSKLKYQNPKRILYFGNWDLFGICNFEFGI